MRVATSEEATQREFLQGSLAASNFVAHKCWRCEIWRRLRILQTMDVFSFASTKERPEMGRRASSTPTTPQHLRRTAQQQSLTFFEEDLLENTARRNGRWRKQGEKGWRERYVLPLEWLQDWIISVVILFKSVGDAPPLRESKFKLQAKANFQTVVDFLRRQLRFKPTDPLVLRNLQAY